MMPADIELHCSQDNFPTCLRQSHLVHVSIVICQYFIKTRALRQILAKPHELLNVYAWHNVLSPICISIYHTN